ncbi:MAG: alkaline phosphatase [Tenacibaculum sp.]
MIAKLIFFFILMLSSNSFAQHFKWHSHNDYQQNTPFWTAYNNGSNSIEIDVFLKNNTLYVAHSESEIIENRTLESLYLKPLIRALKLNIQSSDKLQFLIDIKSDSYKTLKRIVETLKKYPSLLQNKKFSFVISGNRPNPKDYGKYPDFIQFDYQSLQKAKDVNWDKVALISLDFKNYSNWNGKGRLTHSDKKSVLSVVKKAHSMGKPFRFWGAPDSKTAWKAFADLGIDFINTDKPYQASKYLLSLPKNTAKTFVQSKVYKPLYNYNPSSKPKNIILLIGDGNGLTQISAAMLANGGELSITQLQSIGLLKTASADDFTTDSAAAATAMATGKSTNNRAIGVNTKGEAVKNLAEILQEKGFLTGIVTTDKITGATPAAFYAHQGERDDTENIKTDLVKSKLNLFMGGGKSDFSNTVLSSNFNIVSRLEDISENPKSKIAYFFSEKEVPSMLEGRKNLLARATQEALNYMSSKGQPFFLLIESSYIDYFGHFNIPKGITEEGIDFDRAISKALKFADTNSETLVVITADHETGGFSIPQGDIKKGIVEGSFTTDDHTGGMIPIFCYGPQSNNFQGVYQNTEVFHKILESLNISKKK